MKCKENVVGALYRDSKDTLYSFSKKGELLLMNYKVRVGNQSNYNDFLFLSQLEIRGLLSFRGFQDIDIDTQLWKKQFGVHEILQNHKKSS